MHQKVVTVVRAIDHTEQPHQIYYLHSTLLYKTFIFLYQVTFVSGYIYAYDSIVYIILQLLPDNILPTHPVGNF